jgi:hypothetical protein
MGLLHFTLFDREQAGAVRQPLFNPPSVREHGAREAIS